MSNQADIAIEKRGSPRVFAEQSLHFASERIISSANFFQIGALLGRRKIGGAVKDVLNSRPTSAVHFYFEFEI